MSVKIALPTIFYIRTAPVTIVCRPALQVISKILFQMNARYVFKLARNVQRMEI